MKKRMLQVFTAVGVTGVLGFSLFFLGYVILGEKEANNKVNAYEIEHNRNPKEICMKYDWYAGGGYMSDSYRYNPDKDIIFDEEYNELWRPYFNERMEEINRFLDHNFIMKDYGLATYFDGTDKITRYDDLFIYGIYNTQQVEKERRIEKGAEMIMNIISELDGTYNFCGIHIDYYDLDGVYKFSVPIGKEKVTKEMLIEAAMEVSFEENSAIKENWEAFVSQRVTLWTLAVGDYEVSMRGMEDYGNYQLILKDGECEKVAWIYPNYGEVVEYDYDTFENILGYSGFYIFDNSDYANYGNFYTILDGEVICIANTYQSLPEDCYSVDVDNNGVPELICNMQYGTGEREAHIYRNNNSKIVQGSCSGLLGITDDSERFFMLESCYIPDEELVEITYWTESMEYAESKKYEIDLSKITFWDFISR